MIQRTKCTGIARKFTNGIIEHAPHTAIAIPTDFPGLGSSDGMLLNLNSFAKESASAETTRKIQIMPTKGIKRSQTIPGCMVRQAGEHLLKIPLRKAM